MAIGALGGAFQAASFLLGIRAQQAVAEAPLALPEDTDAEAFAPLPLDADFAPGSPYFEAVASALDQAGYLDA